MAIIIIFEFDVILMICNQGDVLILFDIIVARDSGMPRFYPASFLLSFLHNAPRELLTKNNSQKMGEKMPFLLSKMSEYPSVKSSVKLGNSMLFRFLTSPSPKTLMSTFISYYTLPGCLIKKLNPMISLFSVCSQPIFNSVASQCVHLNLKSDRVCVLLRSLQRLPVDLRLKSKTFIMPYKAFLLTSISFFFFLS